MNAGEHVMVVIAETEDADAEYQLECGGVTPSCEAWQECDECTASEHDIEDGEYLRHGIEHQVIEGVGMTRTGRCVLHALDVDGPPLDQLYDRDGHQALATGRHPIVIDDCVEGTAYIGFAPHEGGRL